MNRTLLTTILCLSLGTNVIAQERNPFGTPIKSADPFNGVIEKTPTNSNLIKIPQDREVSLLPNQATLENGAKIIHRFSSKPIGCLKNGSSANWQIDVQEAGIYTFTAKVASWRDHGDLYSIFSVGNISKKWFPIRTVEWDKFAEIVLFKQYLPKGIQPVKITAPSPHGLNIAEIRVSHENVSATSSPTIAQERNPFGSSTKSTYPIERVIENTQKKDIEELRKRPRFGMSMGEINLLWGKPTGTHGIYSEMARGVKKEHERYINKSTSAPIYKVGEVLITVFYYHGRATCFRVGSNKDLTVEGMREIMEEIYKVKFAKFPNDTNKNFAVYSTDREQAFLFQYNAKANRAIVLYMPSWTQYWTEREAKVSDKIAEDALNQDIIKKKTEALRARPRLGMTEEELTLLWGKPVRRDTDKNTWVTSNPMNGQKKQHPREMMYWHPFAFAFDVDILRIHVSFHKNKAFAMMVMKRNTNEKMTTDALTTVAESLTKVKFGKLPINAGSNYAVYSTDREQTYMLQYQGERCVIIHMPSWISQRNEHFEAKKVKIKLDKTLQSL